MMRIIVTVIPRARRPHVEPLEDGGLRVAVTAPPHEGRANAAVIAALAEHFHVPRSRVRILRGKTSRRKVVEIVDI
jgi:uncharacterized protein (TIGR00251 family)